MLTLILNYLLIFNRKIGNKIRPVSKVQHSSKIGNPYQLTSPVQYQVNDLLANGVMPTSIIIGSILFASDELLRVEELAVCASSHFICAEK